MSAELHFFGDDCPDGHYKEPLRNSPLVAPNYELPCRERNCRARPFAHSIEEIAEGFRIRHEAVVHGLDFTSGERRSAEALSSVQQISRANAQLREKIHRYLKRAGEMTDAQIAAALQIELEEARLRRRELELEKRVRDTGRTYRARGHVGGRGAVLWEAV